MRSYTALRNVYVLVTAVFYFVSAVLGRRTKLKVLFERMYDKALRFYEIATCESMRGTTSGFWGKSCMPRNLTSRQRRLQWCSAGETDAGSAGEQFAVRRR